LAARGFLSLKFCDRPHYLAAMSNEHTELFEVLLRKLLDDREINGVLVEALGVFPQTDRGQPPCNTCHGKTQG
jgi:hypothetical protein